MVFQKSTAVWFEIFTVSIINKVMASCGIKKKKVFSDPLDEVRCPCYVLLSHPVFPL